LPSALTRLASRAYIELRIMCLFIVDMTLIEKIMIDFIKISKHFGVQEVLKDVSVRINKNERVGIVGPNGSGKSTLFGLISGDVFPDKGEVSLPKNFRIGYMHQQLNPHSVNSSLLEYVEDAVPKIKELEKEIETVHKLLKSDSSEENLEKLGKLQEDFERLGGYGAGSRVKATLSGLGFKADEFNNPFKLFSGGWQMRAELARVLVSMPDILLLDEPSNYLDVPAVEWIQQYLREFQGTMLLVSHDRFLLNSLTNVTIEVSNKQLTRYSVNYNFYLKEREVRHSTLLAAKKNQDRKIDDIERFVRKFRAKNTKSSQVQSRLKQLEKMERVELPAEGPDLSKIKIASPPHCGSQIISLEEVSFTYDAKNWILKKINLNITRGDKIALIGFNGMGKTTLMRIFAGVLNPTEGRRKLGHKVITGYQSQDFSETMAPEKTVYNIVREMGKNEKTVRSILGSFGFSDDAINKNCEVLSGGEKIRLAFARIFVNPPNFLLLDEPTTHLDINGRKALEESLKKYTGTICLVSHDIAFVRNVADSIIALTPEGIKRYPGGYDYYCEKTKGENPPEENKHTSGETKSENQIRRELQKEFKRKKSRLEKLILKLEENIGKLENEKKLLVRQIENGGTEFYFDEKFAEITEKLNEIESKIEGKTKEWERAMAELEKLGGKFVVS